jgi:hypothetical protein
MDGPVASAYLHDIVRTFRNYKTLGERAIAQTPDANLHTLLDPDANSLAIIVKHIAGNLRSRFADFLTTDGEKPDRHRDSEFEASDASSRDEILAWWEGGWGVALDTLETLQADDLARTVSIRGEPFLIPEALNRASTHIAYHVGQIVLLSKHFAGPRWMSLSIPKGRSSEHAVGRFKNGIVPHSVR